MNAEERAIVEAAQRITRRKNRERRQAVKALRAVAEHIRGRVRDKAYLAYLRRQPCRIGRDCDGPVQAAHLRYGDAAYGRVNPGMQVKPDDKWATSLCAKHHAEQHTGNERSWWNSYGLDGSEVAAAQYAEFSLLNPHGEKK